MKQNITIEVDVKEGYELKFNPETMTIEQIKKKPIRSKSWEEFCKNHPPFIREFYIGSDSKPYPFIPFSIRKRDPETDKCLLEKTEDVEGIVALIQLKRLHDEWVGDWKPNWSCDYTTKYVILYSSNECQVLHSWNTSRLLSFPTKEMADEFLTCFEDLIEKAKRFI